MESYIIKEHNIIYCKDDFSAQELGNDNDGNLCISEICFNHLEGAVLKNREEENETGDFLYLTQKGGRKILKARNYVGVLQTKNGTTIEILPKIHTIEDKNDKEAKNTKKIFLKMLRRLGYKPNQHVVRFACCRISLHA